MPNRENELNTALEAMHFGFRAMIKKPDLRLAELGFSRIHHRILYFVGRNSNCSINELLDILNVTKQYLNKPLKRLIDDQYLISVVDPNDHRVKRLSHCEKGLALETRITGEQRKRFEMIFKKVGPEAEKNWHQVMQLLMDETIY